MMTLNSRNAHVRVEQRTKDLIEYAENCEFNRVEMGNDTSVGIITDSTSYQYAREVLGEDACILKLGLINPLPEKLIKDFAAKVDKVVVLEENLFPSALSLNSYKELEEERRLFYVAITRAEEHCYLSFAKSRFKYGKMEFSSPSRFLKDIDVHFLKLPQEEQMARRIDERASRFCREQNERASRFLFDESASQPSYGRSSSNLSGGQKSFFIGERPKAEIIRPSVPRNLTKVGLATVSKPSAAGTLPVNVLAGQVIEHERFGIGDVIKVEGTGENSKATVRFRNAGEKQLLLKFARFKVVE